MWGGGEEGVNAAGTLGLSSAFLATLAGSRTVGER